MVWNIPVKPYTLKFLRVELGEHYKLSRLDPYGVFLSALLRRPNYEETWIAKVLDQYKSHFIVACPVYMFTERDVKHLTNRTIHDFNSFVEGQFYKQLCAFVNLARKQGFQISESILLFNEEFGITELDLKLETQLKQYERYREKRGEKTPRGPKTLTNLSDEYGQSLAA